MREEFFKITYNLHMNDKIDKLKAMIRSNASEGEKNNARDILKKIEHAHDWMESPWDKGRTCKICELHHDFIDIHNERYPQTRPKLILLIDE